MTLLISFLKPDFCNDLRRIGNTLRVFGAFAGDFTVILKQKEKMGSRPLSSRSMCRFQSLVDDLGLIDLGYSRNPFT